MQKYSRHEFKDFLLQHPASPADHNVVDVFGTLLTKEEKLSVLKNDATIYLLNKREEKLLGLFRDDKLDVGSQWED